MPAWYLDEPFLETADFFFLRAFGDLNTCRAAGFGGGAIPWTAIVQYGDREGMDQALVDALVIIIRGMESAYNKFQDDERERLDRIKQGRIGNTTKTR